MRNLVVVLVLGCSSGAQINITKSVGAEGGDITANDGTSLTVPMDALGMSTTITITPVNVPAPPGTILVGPAYDFEPEGMQFQKSVTITLPYDTAKIPSGLSDKDIVIYTAPRGTTHYSRLYTSLGSGNKVSAQTTHLSVYLPATPAAPCMPACAGSSGSVPACGCSTSCNGNLQEIECQEESGGMFSCFCDLNHQTTNGPTITTCDDIQSAFNTCFRG
jgi:ZU5 domain